MLLWRVVHKKMLFDGTEHDRSVEGVHGCDSTLPKTHAGEQVAHDVFVCNAYDRNVVGGQTWQLFRCKNFPAAQLTKPVTLYEQLNDDLYVRWSGAYHRISRPFRKPERSRVPEVVTLYTQL
jgi:hypothetical protein